MILHYDGTTWNDETQPFIGVLRAVSGSGAAEVYAGGYQGPGHDPGDGILLKRDGPGWSPMTLPAELASHPIDDVWAPATGGVFVVAGDRVGRYEGDTWTVWTLPGEAKGAGIWGFSSTDVYVAGRSSGAGAILHFDGTSWTPESIPLSDPLTSIHGSAFLLVAVGTEDVVAKLGPTGWTLAADDVGAGLNDVRVFGSTAYITGGGGILARADASGYTLLGVLGRHCNGVWGATPSSLYVVGNTGTLGHYDGTTYRELGRSSIADADLWAVFAFGTTAFAGGPYSFGGPAGRSLLVAVEGATPRVASESGPANLYGLWGTSPTDLLGAGYDGIDTSRVWRFDGTTWTPEALPFGTCCSLVGIWGSSANDVYVAGGLGNYSVLHYDGTSWAREDESLMGLTTSVWGSGPDDVYVVGRHIRRWDGVEWSNVDAGVNGVFLRDVWGSGPNDVWIVGNMREAAHFDGTDWELLPMPPDPQGPYFFSIWGTGPSDVYAVGGAGAIVHYNGVSFTRQESLTSTILRGVVGTDTGVYAVGDQSTILRRAR